MVSLFCLIVFRATLLSPGEVPDHATGPKQKVSVSGSVHGDIIQGNKYGFFEIDSDKKLKQKHATLKIQRLFEDFSVYLKDTAEKHNKEINQIAQQHNYRGTYSSGPHIREQYELARIRRREISSKQVELKRRMEDEALSAGQSELTDEELKRQYVAAEAAAEQLRSDVLDATHSYFASRRHTFPQITELEKLRQAIIDDKPI